MHSLLEEFENASTNIEYRKEFLYVEGVLSGYTIYYGKLPLFFVSITVKEGSLLSKTILRVSDNKVLVLKNSLGEML